MHNTIVCDVLFATIKRHDSCGFVFIGHCSDHVAIFTEHVVYG